MVKQCTKCRIEKPLEKFYKGPKYKGKQYYNGKCKSCMNDVNAKWKKNNPEKSKAITSKYNASDKYKIVHEHFKNKKGKGVYGIFSGMTCLYVGESSTLHRRISHHKSNIKYPENAPTKGETRLYYKLQSHNDIEFRILEQTDNHKEQEQVWIDYLNPLYNGRN
jgi:hypothetical protein